MTKSYNHLWENMIDPANMERCIKKASRGKRKRQSVRKVLNDMDGHIRELTDLLDNEQLKPVHCEKTKTTEGSRRKERKISKVGFKYEQIVDHLLLSQLVPILEKKQNQHSYSCIEGRGPHKAKRTAQIWCNSYKGKKFYVAELDVKSAYETVDLDLLYSRYKKMIRDQKFLRLIERNIYGTYNPTKEDRERAKKEGLPLGRSTSPWHANFYFQTLDYYILQELKPDHYMRFADNLFLWSKSKKELHKMVRAIGDYLQVNLHQRLKGDWQVYRFEYFERKTEKTRGRTINCIGFVIHHNRVTMRKSILKRKRRRVYRLDKKLKTGKKITHKLASAILSDIGEFRHYRCHNYFEKYLAPILTKKVKRLLRKIVREHQKKEDAKYGGIGMAVCTG